MLHEDNPDEREGAVAAPRRRRFWSREEKLRIMAECREPGASVSLVARRNDVNANQVFTWRRLYRDGRLGGGKAGAFLPVMVRAGDPPPEPASSSHSGRMEILLGPRTRVVVDATVDAAALARVLDVLERP